MKTTGITAEFDPLHNGHVYVIEEARRLTGCDALVVAMSGDFVQRGEPAVTDKWARTRAALLSGADLIVEIPVLFCLGNASQYAAASVRLLEGCGCDNIAFGSESGDAKKIEKTSEFIRARRSDIDEGIRELLSEGLSWPAARARVFKELSGCDIPENPNDILALEYVMNMEYAEPVAVQRDEGYKSASEIRRVLSEKRHEVHNCPEEIRGWMPAASYDILEDSVLTFPDEWTTVLRYAVMSADVSDIEDCPSAGEGLANLLAKAAASEDRFEDIISAVKSKRYTHTRISRLCMQAVLGLTRTKYAAEAPEYIRVLGFTEKGRQLLSDIKSGDGCSLPVITNINKGSAGLGEAALRMLELDIHAADIYNLVTGRDCTKESDHVRKPVIV